MRSTAVLEDPLVAHRQVSNGKERTLIGPFMGLDEIYGCTRGSSCSTSNGKERTLIGPLMGLDEIYGCTGGSSCSTLSGQ